MAVVAGRMSARTHYEANNTRERILSRLFRTTDYRLARWPNGYSKPSEIWRMGSMPSCSTRAMITPSPAVSSRPAGSRGCATRNHDLGRRQAPGGRADAQARSAPVREPGRSGFSRHHLGQCDQRRVDISLTPDEPLPVCLRMHSTSSSATSVNWWPGQRSSGPLTQAVLPPRAAAAISSR